MKTIEEKTKDAISRLRNLNYSEAADRLEQSLEKGTIELKPGNSHIEHLIFAALIFSDAQFIIDANPTYTFQTK